MDADLVVRRATPADEPAIRSLLATSLGWRDDDVHADLYAWKHLANPFGPSAAWVALDGDRLAGVRLLLRWQFDTPDGTVTAVRAVDTATHPDFRGRRIFTSLTLAAVDELAREGVGFVFNTPNDSSRPGYLKMGWEVVGRVPIAARPVGVRALPRLAGVRAAAGKWASGDGVDSAVTAPAAEVLVDDSALDALVAAAAPARRGLVTRRSGAYLRWRYAGLPALGYRVATLGAGVDEGAAVFRVRGRGSAREAAICEVLVPGGGRRAAAALVSRVARASRADYVLAAGAPGAMVTAGLVPVPRRGPILTWRALAGAARPAGWSLALGDVELF